MKRVPPSPEFAIAQAVQRLQEKFDYPDDLGGGGPVTPTGGGGAPTIVVASSESTTFSRSKADFQCTGTGDDVVIQGALDILAESVNFGGLLWLTEGRYFLGSTITVPCGVVVRGMSRYGTIIFGSFSGTAVDLRREGAQLQEISVNGGFDDSTGIEYGTLSHLVNVTVNMFGANSIGAVVLANTTCGPEA